MKTWHLFFIVLIALIFTLLYVINPFRYHSQYNESRSIVHSVLIKASPDRVFNYLGNSANASNWSIFVHHITPINAQEVPDGKVGSIRRCFTRADETGSRWDETILIVEPSKRRRISCYNLMDFAMTADNLCTEQIYRDLGNNQIELVFTVFYLEKPDQWTDFKTRIASWVIQYIFKTNMENIKQEVEKNTGL